MRFQSSRPARAQWGPRSGFGLPKAMDDRKRAGTHSKWLNFGSEMGHDGASPVATSWSSERASRGYAARRVTPPVRKVRPFGSFGVPPAGPRPLIKHYIAHHSAGAIIPALMHRIPSELRSQACLGESSTRMGDPLGSPRVAPLFANLSSRLSSHQLFLFFFFFCSPTRYRSSMRFQSSRASSGSVGPTVRVWPPNAMDDRKWAGTHPKWLNFWQNGARGKPNATSWSSERASRGYADRRVTPPVRKVRPFGSFGVPPAGPRPLIKHYGAHHSAGAIIPALMHRIPSELRSQACLGESSTRMGDPLGSPRVAPLFATSPPVCQVISCFFSFFFLRSPTRYCSLHEIPELPGQLGLSGAHGAGLAHRTRWTIENGLGTRNG
ncbi:UNVERIFIED_CONTAM: hypothetical protein Sradi_7227100 [Sesamum radiatum]|uniref:Uncharacterized protein n=1 Tax=Sesamum radiatum TaxID=300843 RepID=A0AAW2IN96_SESRA